MLVRPHHVLGGRGMHVARSADELRVDGPVLVDRYLEGALELDVDALCDGEDAWVAAMLEHVEPAGVHSGDSACVLPGPVGDARARGRDPRGRDARSRSGIGARGLLNLQLALHDGRLYVLEANPRASRTVPFVAKATGVPLVEHSVRLLLGEPLAALDLPERAVPDARVGEGGGLPDRALPGRGDARPGDALDRRGDGRRATRPSRRTGARSARPGARGAAGRFCPSLQAAALS